MKTIQISVKPFVTCFLLCLLSTGNIMCQIMTTDFGVSLCGAEFGINNLPGKLNINYTYPTADEIKYFSQKGIHVVQLPIRWERIQKEIGGPLDAVEMKEIKSFLNSCHKEGISVIINLHNFGRYIRGNKELIIGSPQLPVTYFKDVWQKIAQELKGSGNIYAYDLMNEPHDMLFMPWSKIAQAGIEGIRQSDWQNPIMVEGDQYSTAGCWVRFNDELKYLKDPSSKIIFNAHCYFDYDNSGKYQRDFDHNNVNPYTGIQKVKPFVDWLLKNKFYGFVGEFGVPKTDSRWLIVLENFLNYLDKNNISGTYWAAGPWWKNYSLSIEPEDGQDQPQMAIYAKYFAKYKYANNSTAVLTGDKTY